MREGVQHLLRAVGEFALGPFEIAKGDRRLRGAHHDRKAQLGRLERGRDDVSLHLDQLRLRHLGLGIRFEVAVRILLRGRHLLEALLVALEHLHLVGDHDLSADDDRETKCREVLQHPRKGRIGKFLEAHNRVEIPIDVQVGLGLVEDARLGRLLPRAAVLDHLLAGHIRPPIAPDRVLRVLQFLEEFLRRQSPGPEAGRLHRPLDAPEDGFELRQIGLMLLARTLDGLLLAQSESTKTAVLLSWSDRASRECADPR